jgi:thiosulfate/3-mercaptopyruvate sulfurtransferase
MLVQPAALEAELHRPGLRILDTRAQDEYGKSHIPGAVVVDVKSWQRLGSRSGGFQDAKAWSEAVGRLGIALDSEIVVYGNRLPETARVWWTLKYLGLPSVSILEGGWDLWAKEHRPSETVTPAVQPTTFVPKFQLDRLEEIDSLKKSLGSDRIMVIDTRSTEEYTGKAVLGKRGGHIPGATLLEWKDLVGKDGRFKSAETLRALFKWKGIDPDRTTITC